MDSTLKELSDRLALSPSTISRALNGREPQRAGARARVEQIRRVAAEMGYAPNSMARSLRTKRRQVVGLIVPDIMNDYYAAAATLVHQTLVSEGYRMLLCVSNDDPVVEVAHRRALQEERAAGTIVVPSPKRGQPSPRHSSTGLNSGAPVVELVRQSGAPGADAVLIDDVDAGFHGTQHLLQLGHQRVAILTGPRSLSTSQGRLTGYRQALEAANITVDEALICSGPYRREAAREAVIRLLDSNLSPTAIIATSNELVMGALQGLAERGTRVPEDLSVVGFGNPDWFALLRPALTTVALPIEEMAMFAVHLLLKRIRHSESSVPGDASPPLISHYRAHLVIRSSTQMLARRT